MELCTLLIEERHQSPRELLHAGDLGEEGGKGAPREREHPGRRELFTHGAGIPGMWPPWGTAWVGLPRQRSFD